MRHLVLTIAAIAAAQIAFQLFVVDDYAPEYAATVAANAWPSDTIVTVRGVLNSTPVEPVRPVAARVKHQKPALRRAESVRASYRRPAPRIRPTLVAKAPQSKQSKKVPRLDGPDRADDDGDGDGKPWIAKALPIVKKPYTWLKALGAKLK